MKLVQVLLLSAALGVSGCSWVKISESGQNVAVIPASQAASCQKLGQVTAKVVNKVAGINRSERKVAVELELMARNDAASMGGNAVTPVSGISEGQQSYDVFRCQ